MPVSSSRILVSDHEQLWRRARAVVDGEQSVKNLDRYIDTTEWSNVLIPFSSNMTQEQYEMYKAEAEVPGLVSMYVNIIIGGLLRKPPSLSLIPLNNTPVPEERESEILNHINENLVNYNTGLLMLINNILREELITSRSAVSLSFRSDENHPNGGMAFPIMWNADEIINWQTKNDELYRMVFRYVVEETNPEDKFESRNVFYYEDHYLDDSGIYQVDTYKDKSVSNAPGNTLLGVSNNAVRDTVGSGLIDGQDLINSVTPIMQGEVFRYLPIWIMNGNIEPEIPMLTPMVDKELALYNKLSRRNHLLYGACTFTPVIYSDSVQEEEVRAIINSGLGTWLTLGTEDSIRIIETPTDALKDMDRAIAHNLDELARMGIRILSPEAVSGTSGIALEIRNSPQTAQLGLLNTRISDNVEEILKVLIKWNFDEDYDVSFSLSEDFNPSPIGPEWIRLTTEWYEAGFIPRSLWLSIGRNNDIIPEDYNDDEGVKELENQDVIRAIPLPREEGDPGFDIER